MGRKPNQAIRWFFERGPKLDDNSNRYQQTCKRCGEKFEKGRHEALVSHIARSCPGVSFHEREKFLTEVSWAKPAAKTKRLALPVGGPTARPALSGLDALAEVSTHHGQGDGQYIAQQSDFMSGDHVLAERHLPQPGVTHQSNSPGSGPFPNIMSQHQQFGFSAASSPSSQLQLAALRALIPRTTADEFLRRNPGARDDGLVEYGHGEAPIVDAAYSRHAMQIEAPEDSPSPGDDLVDYSRGQAPAAEELNSRYTDAEADVTVSQGSDPPQTVTSPHLPQEIDSERERNRMKLVVGYVTNQAPMPSQIPSQSREASVEAHPVSTAPLDAPHALSSITIQNFHYHQASDPQLPQFQIWSPDGPTPTVPKKVRGAFAPDRRDAVKEVRKKGACLRCRMLKKSCDSGDPCKECAKLENARMWKGQCLRTRPHQIFDVYSSTLFMSIAHKAVEDAKEPAPFLPQPGRLEVSYFPDSGICLTFACLSSAASEAEPARLLISAEEDNLPFSSTFSAKFNQYGVRLLSIHYANPDKPLFTISRFMHETLRLALTMQSRVLLARAIDLWICVTMLVAPLEQVLVIYEPHLAPTNSIAESHQPHDQGIDSHLVYLQLRRKLERTADTHFKAVMNELDKALIQRKKEDNFETFIGSLILLRCLEETCYMYKGFDCLISPAPLPHQSILVGSESMWPLETPPSHYWMQGEQFSDLLISMLRLRKVPPEYRVRDGRIKVEDEPRIVREWFEAVNLGIEDVDVARARDVEEVDRERWELRWIGKVFEM